jgi:hypothetical protein
LLENLSSGGAADRTGGLFGKLFSKWQNNLYFSPLWN